MRWRTDHNGHGIARGGAAPASGLSADAPRGRWRPGRLAALSFGLLVAAPALSGCLHRMAGPDEGRIFLYRTTESPTPMSMYYVVTQTGVYVFDAPPSPVDALALSQEIRINSSLPVKAIFVTSALPERYAGAGYLAGLTRAQVWSSTSTAELIGENGPSEVADLAASGQETAEVNREPDRTFETGTSVKLGGTRMYVRAGGAGPASSMSVVELPGLNTLVLGGLAFNGVHPTSLGRTDVWVASLEELAGMEGIDRVLPGLGGAGGPEVLQTDILYLRTLMEEVNKRSPSGLDLAPEMEAEITAAMLTTWPDWSGPEHVPDLVRQEWARQGGLVTLPPPVDDAGPEMYPDTEPLPGEAAEESLAPLFGLEAPKEAPHPPAPEAHPNPGL